MAASVPAPRPAPVVSTTTILEDGYACGPAMADAERFLWRHPWATNEIDNAVSLLHELCDEHAAALEQIDQLQDQLDEHEALAGKADAADKLLEFVRGLHDALKISDIEFERAQAIARGA